MSVNGLTPEQRIAFQRDGYLGPLPCYVDEHGLDQIRASLSDIVTHAPEHPIYGRYSVRDWHLVLPQLAALMTHPVVVQTLRQLLGEDLLLWRSYLDHVSGGGSSTGWFQDWGGGDWKAIGEPKPCLKPMRGQARRDNNVSVWLALDDVTADVAPLKLMRRSLFCRHRQVWVPLPSAAQWQNPFAGCRNVDAILQRAQLGNLVPNVDTSRLFESYDVGIDTYRTVIHYVEAEMAKYQAKTVWGVPETTTETVVLPMKKGEFVLFNERLLHGFLPNRNWSSRYALHWRVTRSDTLIYPERFCGDLVDEELHDITHHENLLLCGEDRSRGANRYRSVRAAPPT
ncbi:phytanoyl-CoA dioxygenase family protein [Vibrio europaeus]|uniref:phytanoyl-CoA dioxygenase family protein n=1 Tax=Vibrio europaeus TaxID=300876 RepID=UPI00233EF28D|nr:hypothetical protein [Vibrio europaeus]MDC5807890.1 phytanoyl-CoA dioxygenase family protein [Vibrio europaeus]MDC5825392.1 phytanoyl-CoA dioxygenase family protein [Vibrio europaeus]MDC5832680.1 phytanoyl-CoA dioxygenase family protein [Vibrio europaeus]MDC5835591.1 phytanoyl-CoA dioxygenase family protein [Vibrio europaeus]